jgi:hypothetical protein
VEQTTTTSEDIDSEEDGTPDNKQWLEGIMHWCLANAYLGDDARCPLFFDEHKIARAQGADVHSLTVTRYLRRLATATRVPMDAIYNLHALDLIRLRSDAGKLNDDLVDAALETLCTRYLRLGTCTTLLWDAAVARRLQTLRPYTDKSVLARCR